MSIGFETLLPWNAGDLTVDTKRLIVRDGASIRASARLGSGDGGNLTINPPSARQNVLQGNQNNRRKKWKNKCDSVGESNR